MKGLKGKHLRGGTTLDICKMLNLIFSQVEDSSSCNVTADSSDRGICARALYDYQAGEFGPGWNSQKIKTHFL